MAEITFKGYKCFLSNHYSCTIKVGDVTFNSSEQYYMYLKAMHFERYDIIDMIMKERYPGNMTKICRKHFTEKENAEWKEYRYEAMKTCVLAKFLLNPNLRDRLIATKDLYLREDTNHTYWGGKNNALGKLLMEIRDRFV